MQEVSPLLLQEITHRLVDEFQPEQIILFGSHAWGKPDKDSDLDLLVIVSQSDLPPTRRAMHAHRSHRIIDTPGFKELDAGIHQPATDQTNYHCCPAFYPGGRSGNGNKPCQYAV